MTNQSNAQGKLSLVESQVASVGDLLQNVRDRLVQAGSTTLTNSDRSYIKTELEARYSELMGLANAQDGEGNYLFSGYQGAVKPFSETASGAAYLGDDGKRMLQVGASRQMATNVSGKELFEAVRNGNGNFVTSAATTGVGAPINTGSGIIDQGSVSDPLKWAAALSAYHGGVQIQFSVTGGVTSYQLFDNPAGTTAYTAPQPYSPGQSIKLERTTAPASDFGSSVVLSGQPANGDTFTIVPSTNQSIFTTLRSAIDTLITGISGAYTSTEYSRALGEEISAAGATFVEAPVSGSQVPAQTGQLVAMISALGPTPELESLALDRARALLSPLPVDSLRQEQPGDSPAQGVGHVKRRMQR